MKKIFYSLAIMFFLYSCQELEEEKHLPQAEVNFSTLSLQQFNTQSEQARTQASAWEHVFAEEVEMLITNNESGEIFTLVFDPNDFFLPKTIMLPYGEYTYMVESAGEEEEFSSYLPFTASGSFLVSSPNLNISLNAETTFGLVSVKNEFVEFATLSNRDMMLTQNGEFYFLYLLNRHESLLRIRDVNDDTAEYEITLDPYMHLHYYLYSSGGNTDFLELRVGDFEYIPEGIALDDITNVVYDNDGNRYRTVNIGNQNWMAENLRSSTFCNGDPIPHVPGTREDWNEVEEPMWTYVHNDESLNYPFGKLYNGYVAIDERNPCPCGYRVPTMEDFQQLVDFVGGENHILLGSLKEAGYKNWMAPNMNATNASGLGLIGSGLFLPVPGGVYRDDNRYIEQYPTVLFGFNFFRMTGAHWSQTTADYVSYNEEVLFESLYSLELGYDGIGNLWVHDGPKHEGLSIRCIKEEEL
ncbi:fibrobacter succinogenes major paralogous domain-containing protein [Litoribacter alkaliphilus]|uniref:Fibrobacter succinogenes major paralogous domain-containing protein n=1 Tax=Litoribacter ruber TaxID=702568 RepID=A0AAP2CP21_9BACT|nr:fibrobacter succinogenes major paralogous domain-containing protein [Litoribacter alkaliphilus]MBS9525267.1 fibrobacter succinogenes major paralogous domain-containing protein [Litoribacter alkaliphilus]